MDYIIKLGKAIFNIIYKFLKLFETKNKILFCSRQSDQISIDYQMIQNQLKTEDSDVQVVNLCKRFRNKEDGIFSFAVVLLKSLYHMATSKVCILDGYWPTACFLKHKPELKIIQIWHSIGKIKKSGYQTLDTEYGRSSKIAKLLCMHKNYDYIITGGVAWEDYYCASFGVDKDVLRAYGLPRVDYLIENKEINRKHFFDKYSELKDKKIVLYVPTFRGNEKTKWESLAKFFVNNPKYTFICKLHPNEKMTEKIDGVYTCEDFSSMEIIAAADYVITDYSSIALEAAALDKRLYYYLYDIEEYSQKNGLNVDVKEMMPKYAFNNPEELFNSIVQDEYDYEALNIFKHKYLPTELGKSTENIVKLIEENLC